MDETTNLDGLTFSDWMRSVDQWIQNLTGTPFTHEDIADWTYALLWEDSVSPYDAAFEALENDGTFNELLFD